MTRITVGPFSGLEEGVGVRVEAGEHRVAIFLVDGELFAIGDRCSHAEASLSEGEVYDHEVECPRHGSGFDLRSGKPLSLPATKPVPSYTVTVEDGTVYVELPE
ncbi:MAG TPA: non-heme iron oxygenase ferredoxin subunit [Acidimicrobiia bacterium]|nr:non-heme iron oxygenase ferredoxin subunit [Acidimicrobiia bacterium]